MKYWALDYVNELDNECELVYRDQLYRSEEGAMYAATATRRPDLFDITWYTELDLEEIYNGPIFIDENLKVRKQP